MADSAVGEPRPIYTGSPFRHTGRSLLRRSTNLEHGELDLAATRTSSGRYHKQTDNASVELCQQHRYSISVSCHCESSAPSLIRACTRSTHDNAIGWILAHRVDAEYGQRLYLAYSNMPYSDSGLVLTHYSKDTLRNSEPEMILIRFVLLCPAPREGGH